MNKLILFFCLSSLLSCTFQSEKELKRFELREETGINFKNILDYTEEVNPYTFKNFYNGGGVGVGDINNDGLQDVFFCGNMVSNRLYLNRGSFQFEDITESAGLLTSDVWSTGVSFVDINYDGLIDIYVCKSGPPDGNERRNSLYINNGDLTFTEQATKYGLDNLGLSTHASFFDYDRDGDLDCYLLNNSIKSVGGYDLIKEQREIPDTLGGNKLLQNNNDDFVDVSREAGIYSSYIGFGLGVTISDIDQDGWPDIYVSNDFFERDYLYLNQQDGTFKESLTEYFTEISMGSMGADIADLNNDGYNEIFVTEMLPERHDRVMSKASFESWDKYQLAVKQGYFHQFARNALQLNNRDKTFSEISRLAGVEATDWSWGALIFDMDNDGLNDLFIANGIFKDLLDQDYINFMANPDAIREMLKKEGKAIRQLIDMIPSEPLPNYAYRNKGDLQFEKITESWGLDKPTFSNGSAYADLDNDGDLDLLLNNTNMPAFIYENTTERIDKPNYLVVELKGTDKNLNALGAKAEAYYKGNIWQRELSPMRGFQSSVDQRLFFGLDTIQILDSVIVTWPNQNITVQKNVKTNQFLTLSIDNSVGYAPLTLEDTINPIFTEIKEGILQYEHEENTFVDFDRDRLLFEMASNEGPCACQGDLNGDGLEDFYLGGGRNQAGSIYVQQPNGKFRLGHKFDNERSSEDSDCLIADLNMDGKNDLVVASGGSEFTEMSLELKDRVYLNEGNIFRLIPDAFPSTFLESTGAIATSDINGDGYPDLFLGSRLKPRQYGVPVSGHIMINQKDATFRLATEEIAPGLKNIGMITDAMWEDIDGDGDDDLLVAGEWTSIKLFKNENGRLDEYLEGGFSNSSGMYNTIHLSDVDKDGDLDLLAGNHGLNSRFRASVDQPIRIVIGDFDQNGSIEHITAYFQDGAYYPMVQLKDLVKQVPIMKKKFLKFESYKDATLTDIVGEMNEGVLTYELTDLETALFLNNGSGTFTKGTLPIEAQFSNVYAIQSGDYNSDGQVDFILAGNQYRAKPETGIYAANYGQLFLGDGHGGFRYVHQDQSGLSVQGEVRSILQIEDEDHSKLFFIRNNQEPYIVSSKQ